VQKFNSFAKSIGMTQKSHPGWDGFFFLVAGAGFEWATDRL